MPDKIPYDEWFHHDYKNPLDSMPIATDKGGVDWEDTAPSEYEPPRPEEEIADDITLHEKMYQIATAKYNPFAVGGSESINSIGGSENVHR